MFCFTLLFFVFARERLCFLFVFARERLCVAFCVLVFFFTPTDMNQTESLRCEDVVIDAKRLKSFFFKFTFDKMYYEEENKLRSKLLKYVPERCNFELDDSVTRVTDLVPWHKPKSNLASLLSLNFCSGAEIQVSADYYASLKPLGILQQKILGIQRPLPRSRDVETCRFREFLLKWKLI